MRHAPRRGIVHRDLKPSNVLLHGPLQEGPDFIPRIIDFGLARLMDQGAAEATASFAALGSAPFMAPEQVEGKNIGPATDVYGLGAILYTMLCDRPPHRGASDPDTLTGPGRRPDRTAPHSRGGQSRPRGDLSEVP